MSQGSRYCHKCGAVLPNGSDFCPICGTPVATASPSAQVPTPRPSSRQYEKQEKHEKREKGEKGEKNEKGRGGDLAGAITGGLVLILLGVLLYYASIGTTAITFANFWQYFILGVGVILILQGLIRLGERGRAYVGSFIGGAVMIIIGLGLVSGGYVDLWPLILVVLGVVAIASAFTARRRSPVP